MNSRDIQLDELHWLHDAEIRQLKYEMGENGLRSIQIRIHCPADVGLPGWQIVDFDLLIVDAVICRTLLLGHSTGRETIDAVHQTVSESCKEMIAAGRRIGIHFPELKFTIVCHSGGSLEFVCAKLLATAIRNVP